MYTVEVAENLGISSLISGDANYLLSTPHIYVNTVITTAASLLESRAERINSFKVF